VRLCLNDQPPSAAKDQALEGIQRAWLLDVLRLVLRTPPRSVGNAPNPIIDNSLSRQ